jgi:protein-tyrosine phosphatase
MLGGEVFWIGGEPRAWLAIVLRPRPEDWIKDDLQRCAECGIDTLVSLLEPREAKWLGLELEESLANQLGMEFLNYPIRDGRVPIDVADFRTFVSGLADRLRTGSAVGVHCQGSIGRSTVTAACTLIHLGWTPEAAIEAIRKARGCEVPETEDQYEWILNYKAEP